MAGMKGKKSRTPRLVLRGGRIHIVHRELLSLQQEKALGKYLGKDTCAPGGGDVLIECLEVARKVSVLR